MSVLWRDYENIKGKKSVAKELLISHWSACNSRWGDRIYMYVSLRDVGKGPGGSGGWSLLPLIVSFTSILKHLPTPLHC